MTQPELCERIDHVLKTAPIHDHLGYEALAYLKLPGPDYLAVLHALHRSLKPKLYIEIGTRRGASLMQALPETRCIGIDPVAQIEPRPNTLVANATSDAFFAVEHNREKCRGFDLAFIDGDHSYEQARRDFENLAELAGPQSIIALHDVIPMDERTATPQAQSSFHTGDVWKLMADIVHEQRDLIAFTVACPPTGLGIVGRLGGMWPLVGQPWPLIPPWELQEKILNIVPNTPAAISAAFRGNSNV